MPITGIEARRIAWAFARDYPRALDVAYKFREDVMGLYGSRAAKVPKKIKGGYASDRTIHNGRIYWGRVDVPLKNIDDGDDLLKTLRHEVLGHYGTNTFTPPEKRALLDGLSAARNEPTLKPLWDAVDRRYANQSLDVRAEEVFAIHCEYIEPDQHVGRAHVRERGAQSFLETCIARVRPMQAQDLQNIVCMVAEGLHDRTRTQQNFPQFNESFRKKDERAEPKKPYHEVVAERLIEQLKAGTAPWQKPWESGAYLPTNPVTGKRYKGINAVHLMAQGHSDARWMTYKQAATIGAQVRKGEKGTGIQYWKTSEERAKLDSNGKPVLDAKGEPVTETVRLERPRAFFATVFNAEQIDGLPPPEPRKEKTWNAIERAEHILKTSGAAITHTPGGGAFYRPADDSITLPAREQFPSADSYYATALHELGHWTGHPSRLARDLAHSFGSEGYAKEELRAEIASMIVGDELGIGHDPGQHAAYVGSWIKVLQNDPMEVFHAAADAEKIHNYVLAFEQKQVQAQDATERFRIVEPPAQSQEINMSQTPKPLQLFENNRENHIKNGIENILSRPEDPFVVWVKADLEALKKIDTPAEREQAFDYMSINAKSDQKYRVELYSYAPHLIAREIAQRLDNVEKQSSVETEILTKTYKILNSENHALVAKIQTEAEAARARAKSDKTSPATAPAAPEVVAPAPQSPEAARTAPQLDSALDAQALARLARVRAADRAAVEQQLGLDSSPNRIEPDTAHDAAHPQPSSAAQQPSGHRPRQGNDAAVPPEVERQYLRVGNKFYHRKRPEFLAFEDTGRHLETRSDSGWIAVSMVHIAQARGWDRITVSGTQAFRREVWLEAAAQGIGVKGYTPSEKDAAVLAKRQDETVANRVGRGDFRGRENSPPASGDKPAGAAATGRASAKQETQVTGVVVAHGPAKYLHDEKNGDSYFVTMRDSTGVEKTSWGVDLKRAMEGAGVNTGDRVTLTNEGNKPVTITVPVRDAQGHVIGHQEKDTHRNVWHVAMAETFRTESPEAGTRKHPELAGAYAVTAAMDNKAAAAGLSAEQRAVVAARIRQNVASSIERGELPTVHRRVEVQTEAQVAPELSR